MVLYSYPVPSFIDTFQEDIEINFYFSGTTDEISKKLKKTNSPLKFQGIAHDLGLYSIKSYEESVFSLMDNEEDWLYEDNKLKTQMIGEFDITPKALLFHRTSVIRRSVEFTRLVSDFLILEGLEFFLLCYCMDNDYSDLPVYVNKPLKQVSMNI